MKSRARGAATTTSIRRRVTRAADDTVSRTRPPRPRLAATTRRALPSTLEVPVVIVVTLALFALAPPSFDAAKGAATKVESVPKDRKSVV